MVRLAAIIGLALALAGCDVINSAKDTFKNATATAEDLEVSTGVRPTVGFNWTNGTPTTVQGTFMFGDPGTGVAVGEPATLTYYDWVTMQHQVEFEFRDLPLP